MSSQASRTAVLVCQGRAAAHGRIAPDRFADPTAMALLHPDEREQVRWVRDDAPPTGWKPRLEYEMVRGAAEVIVPRTVAIDDAIAAHPAEQLVILGAGLDGRAWRLPVRTVFEVDQPASQQDKRARAEALPGTPPRFVPVDFTDDRLPDALATAGHDPAAPTTWVWEGVIPYLTRPQTVATLTDVATLSPAGSRLIVNFQTPSLPSTAGRLLARAMAGRTNVWAQEPHRASWSPAAMTRLLAATGFHTTTGADMLAFARSLPMPITGQTSLKTSHVLVADRS